MLMKALLLSLLAYGSLSAQTLTLPPVSEEKEKPAARKRVAFIAPEYQGTKVHHALYLSSDWSPNWKTKKRPFPSSSGSPRITFPNQDPPARSKTPPSVAASPEAMLSGSLFLTYQKTAQKTKSLGGVTLNNITFLDIPISQIFPTFPNPIAKHPHTDRWPLLPSPSRNSAWDWYQKITK